MSSINQPYGQRLIQTPLPAAPEPSCWRSIMEAFCCCCVERETDRAPLLATRFTHEPSSMQRASRLPAPVSPGVLPAIPSLIGPPATPTRGASPSVPNRSPDVSPIRTPVDDHSPEPSPAHTPAARLPNSNPRDALGGDSSGGDSSGRDSSTASRDPQDGVGGYRIGNDSSVERDPLAGVE